MARWQTDSKSATLRLGRMTGVKHGKTQASWISTSQVLDTAYWTLSAPVSLPFATFSDLRCLMRTQAKHPTLRSPCAPAETRRWLLWRNLLQGTLTGIVRIFQKFRKRVGGQRGLAQGNPFHTINSGLCSAPFFYAPLSRRTQSWGAFLLLVWALLVANALPPTPFRNL